MTGKHQTASLIADTAMELFRKKGYESVSVNSICEQAGVSRVTFYSIFSNKDQIIGFILNDFQNQFKEDFSSFIAAENDFERVMILFNYYVELSERGGYQLMLELLKAELERSIGIMDAVYVFNDWSVKLIGNCQKSGIIRNKGNAASLFHWGFRSRSPLNMNGAGEKGLFPIGRKPERIWRFYTTSPRLTVKAGKAICSTMPGSVLEPGIAMLIIVSF